MQESSWQECDSFVLLAYRALFHKFLNILYRAVSLVRLNTEGVLPELSCSSFFSLDISGSPSTLGLNQLHIHNLRKGESCQLNWAGNSRQGIYCFILNPWMVLNLEFIPYKLGYPMLEFPRYCSLLKEILEATLIYADDELSSQNIVASLLNSQHDSHQLLS